MTIKQEDPMQDVGKITWHDILQLSALWLLGSFVVVVVLFTAIGMFLFGSQ